ncbi:bifunctional Delta(1)-pyrroline-2-carboxylate/Delta(1)-piperideine-2-carboxylate reductase [Shewanella marisflavi]|uniref:Ornithine cyclodeaminase n=1 Tax=Shewanella marisflavi TaxID=260364 RepID=A0AAC9TVJ7_9GAMM|nr:ornithine cyclodeaminase family protein [Shewanella marisflavi]ASJ95910.1 ornithine cyclodeaminase [Shewanella marisflavi]
MQVIDADSVHQALDFPSLIEALKQTFAKPARMPQRQVFPLDENSSHSDAFAVLPAWNQKTIAVKAFTYFPENPKKSADLESLYSKILIFNRETGVPQALVDGTSVTYWRTAAVSALASQYLSRQDTKHLLLFGTGRLATFMALAHASVRPIEKITVWGRDSAKVDRTIIAIKARAEHINVTACCDLKSAVSTADLISCATGAPAPLFDSSWVKPGTHVDLVGNHNQDRRECDSKLVVNSDVYVDAKVNVFAEAGELLIPVKEGVFELSQVKGELADLCSGTLAPRQDEQSITLFKSVGTALADLVGAQLVFEKQS